MMSRLWITDHFELTEFRCQGIDCACHGAVLFDEELVRALEEFRAVAGGHPIRVLSAFRCDAHNEVVDGHPRSFHRVGRAVDVTSWLLRKDLEKWANTLGEILENRLGIERGNVIWYKKRGFIHVDSGHRIAELVRVNESEKKPRGW